ncbi:hypothetical protein WJX81_007076 [Elliptochloris bilobata]|uniref:Tyrosyl-DNA phosphodiesterase 1 n=1 Tax=Elliptochloris bilobata TaxID=381761 RepID=A0AAW1RMB6_9CHLO
MLALHFPDGSQLGVQGGDVHVVGRGKHGLDDPCVSQTQFAVSCVSQDSAEGLRVSALGTNPLVVEASTSQEGTWTAVHLLDEGHPAAPHAPFGLLRVHGLEPGDNAGALGLRMRDLLRPGMRWCLISNYMIDIEYQLVEAPALLDDGLRVVIVHGDRHPESVKAMREVAATRNWLVHAPELPPYGTHHTKAFIVEYAGGLRVVIYTANLLYGDCTHKTQGAWVQDFPSKDAESPPRSAFGNALRDYLAALKLPPADAAYAIALVDRHDLSSARAALLPSVPGSHRGEAMKRYGHMRARVLLSREVFPAKMRRAPLAWQFSSLGKVSEAWVAQMCDSLSAGSCRTADGQTVPLGPPGGAGVRLVWPTTEQVRQSNQGWAAGGSIPGRQACVHHSALMPLWARWGGEASGRARAMPHIKTYCRFTPDQQLAWFILASHNLSKAAWGELDKRGQQLFIRSYELGVVLLPSLEQKYRAHRHCGYACMGPPSAALLALGIGRGPALAAPATPAVGLQITAADGGHEGSGEEVTAEGVLRVHLPVPYSLPPARYGPGDVPWTVDGRHEGVDALGVEIDGDDND